jgi:holliday junction DNA helicase RuvA
MIAYLSGKIKVVNENFVIILTGGVGYKVFLPATQIKDLATGDEAEFFTHTYLREDAQELYGFKTFTELQLFELLLSVSGVGPKAGLAILGQGEPTEIEKAIAQGNSAIFTKVSGIGTKTAERIILELRGKITKSELRAGGRVTGSAADAVAALRNLGYSESEARDLLRDVDSALKVEDQIKSALKNSH